jgi:hypothetical protein
MKNEKEKNQFQRRKAITIVEGVKHHVPIQK